MATNGTTHQEQYTASLTDNPNTTGTDAAPPPPSKDEVGWYFVEQYYNTLSKNPAKLHLFYNKRSQFVQGLEAELVNVAVGRQAIQDRIKELDFQECKVRVSNVDSQASYDNIVIQVIGEISNKSGEPKKFVQTFVLAQQPAGYFLLNDILRYVNEGDEDAHEEVSEEIAAVAMEPEAPHELSSVYEPEPENVKVHEDAKEVDAALDAQAVDKKLEQPGSFAEDTPSASAAHTPGESAAVEQNPTKPESVEATSYPEKIAPENFEEETKNLEVLKAPRPSPDPSRAPAPEPEQPKGPMKPMSWASRAAAAVGSTVKPAVPIPKIAAPAAQPRSAAAPAAAPALLTQQNTPNQPAEATAQNKTKDTSEWRTAGADSKRQSRQQVATPNEKDLGLAYVKFITDKVKEEDLRAALSTHGELSYFDVNRAKVSKLSSSDQWTHQRLKTKQSCAFIEFASPTACQAAIKASPITIQGEIITIEPRRPKAGAYGSANYNQNRGSISGRGRGGFDGGRSGSQSGGRGGFASRGRGAPRGGRGGVQSVA